MSEDIFLLWNTSLHMTVLTVVQEGIIFKNNIQNCCRDNLGNKHIKESSEESNVYLFYQISFWNKFIYLSIYIIFVLFFVTGIGNANVTSEFKLHTEIKPSKILTFYLQATGRIDIGWTLSTKHKWVSSFNYMEAIVRI